MTTSVIPELSFEQITANLAGKIRHERFNDREYLVAPLSMLVPGVLNGSKGPLLYPDEECKRDPSAWNHMPIVVYHPEDEQGNPTSARDPKILSKQGIGYVFRTTHNGKTDAEGWFDALLTKKVDNRVYQKLEKGEPLELSTGLFTDNEPSRGTFNGRDYTHIARNYRPDHLAVLPDRKGACSVEDGCGVLVNETDKPGLLSKITSAVMGVLGVTENDCGTGAGGFKGGNKCAKGGGGSKSSAGIQAQGESAASALGGKHIESTTVKTSTTTSHFHKIAHDKPGLASEALHEAMTGDRIGAKLATNYTGITGPKQVGKSGWRVSGHDPKGDAHHFTLQSGVTGNETTDEIVIESHATNEDGTPSDPNNNEEPTMANKLAEADKKRIVDNLIANCDCGTKEKATTNGPWVEEDRVALNAMKDEKLMSMEECCKSMAAKMMTNERVANAVKNGFEVGNQVLTFNESTGKFDAKPKENGLVDNLDPATLATGDHFEVVFVGNQRKYKITKGTPAVTTNSETKPQTEEEWFKSAPAGIQSVVRNAMVAEAQAKDQLITQLLANSKNTLTKEQLQSLPLENAQGLIGLRMLAQLAGPEIGEQQHYNLPNYLGAAAPVSNLRRGNGEDFKNEDQDMAPPVVNWAENARELAKAS